jgi:Tol biopolymer transport system component
VNGKPPCPPLLTVPTPPYSGPIWHPSGQFIGFNHVPQTSITHPYGEHCQGEQHWDYDSAGFWLINPDGTNMRRILPYRLQGAAWSPDGEWIAFQLGQTIWKMRFIGTTFDTVSAMNLNPHMSESYVPTWSPDGQWIAFHYVYCSGSIPCGVWAMSSAGQQYGLHLVAERGYFPDWHPFATMALVFMTSGNTGQQLGDSLWRGYVGGPKQLIRFLSEPNTKNRFPKYSPDGSKIVFWSQPPTGVAGNLWLLNSDGTNLRMLTVGGVDGDFGIPFAWSPDGLKIVYTRYHDKWTYDNGTLWTVDIETGVQTQLAFNPMPTQN